MKAGGVGAMRDLPAMTKTIPRQVTKPKTKKNNAVLWIGACWDPEEVGLFTSHLPFSEVGLACQTTTNDSLLEVSLPAAIYHSSGLTGICRKHKATDRCDLPGDA